MTGAKPVQSRAARVALLLFLSALFWVMVAVLGFFIAIVVSVFSEPVGHNTKNPAIRWSTLPPVILWCWAWPIAFRNLQTGLVVRPHWLLGSLLLLLHIAVAFHLGHGWSHQAAWEHTKQVGGYGDGIFANYLFALVWLTDAVWAWIAFDSYRARPRWLNWTIHGFLAFIVFNATVVFGSWSARWTFLFCFLVSLVCVVYEKRRARRLRSEGERGA